MSEYPRDEELEIHEAKQVVSEAYRAAENRAVKVDEITSRFRELRRKNHFRLMLENLFNS